MHGVREIAELAAQLFVAGVWQGVLLVTIVAVALRLLPRASAALRCATWIGAFALAAGLPPLHLISGSAEKATATPGHAVLQVGAGWGYALLAVWAVLVAVRGTRLAMHGMRLRGIWRRATAMETDAATRELLESGGRRAELCRSAEVESPVVIGFLAPRLLLPDALADTVDAHDLRQIALHEMEHLRRRDDWMNLLQKLGMVLFPLHPALLWIDRRLSVERELACDAGVVARTAAPIAYAACLARLAEHRMRCRVAALSLAAWSRRPELSRRVETLLRPALTMSPTQSKFAVALLLLGVGGGAAEMAHAPRLIALAEPARATVAVSGGGNLHGSSAAAVAAPAAMLSGSAAGAARVVPVVYRPETVRAAAGPEMLPPAAAVRATTAEMKVPTARRGKTAATGTPAAHAAAQPRLVLTGATPATGAARRRAAASRAALALATSPRQQRSFREIPAVPVYTLTLQHLPSYAAVPFAGGWILVQL